MTEHYTAQENHDTIQNYHKYAMHTLSEEDFCTEYPGRPGYKIAKIASSLNWTKKNSKNKHSNSWGWS